MKTKNVTLKLLLVLLVALAGERALSQQKDTKIIFKGEFPDSFKTVIKETVSKSLNFYKYNVQNITFLFDTIRADAGKGASTDCDRKLITINKERLF